MREHLAIEDQSELRGDSLFEVSAFTCPNCGNDAPNSKPCPRCEGVGGQVVPIYLDRAVAEPVAERSGCDDAAGAMGEQVHQRDAAARGLRAGELRLTNCRRCRRERGATMWHFALIHKQPGSEEERAADIRRKYPEPTAIIHIDDEASAVLVRADITDDQAQILLDNDKALPGSARLLWFEPWMEADMTRGYRHNREERRNLEQQFGGLRELVQRVSATLPSP